MAGVSSFGQRQRQGVRERQSDRERHSERQRERERERECVGGFMPENRLIDAAGADADRTREAKAVEAVLEADAVVAVKMPMPWWPFRGPCCRFDR